ncbi:hypothetical protein [Rhodoferax ferrireducens]|uniref:hypothetical protein n=1 Tax=Rhodoferax ferrireducens TaxID=192843 RepID=UPI000E0DD5EE|nr:hypothetical protein [Rhodoferax ferrireducens]
MKSFFNSRHTRYTAIVMLFVWLMTLGSGVANACLLTQDHGRYGLSVPASLEVYQNADEHALSPDTVACLSFCAAEQTTLVKVQPQFDGSAGLYFVPVLFFTGLLVPAIDRVSPLEALGSPTWSEPPVSIRFSRLTI